MCGQGAKGESGDGRGVRFLISQVLSSVVWSNCLSPSFVYVWTKGNGKRIDSPSHRYQSASHPPLFTLFFVILRSCRKKSDFRLQQNLFLVRFESHLKEILQTHVKTICLGPAHDLSTGSCCLLRSLQTEETKLETFYLCYVCSYEFIGWYYHIDIPSSFNLLFLTVCVNRAFQF